MIYFINEGDVINSGLSFYKINDKSSIGFKLKIKKYRFVVRYSKHLKKLFLVW